MLPIPCKIAHNHTEQEIKEKKERQKKGREQSGAEASMEVKGGKRLGEI